MSRAKNAATVSDRPNRTHAARSTSARDSRVHPVPRTQRGRPQTGPTLALGRTIEIQNRHPRLRVPAREVKRALALLDAHFVIAPADLPTFSVERRRELQSSARSKSGPSPTRSVSSKRGSHPSAGGCPPGELSLVFLTDAALAQIHADFMNDPTATDVITFEGDRAAGLAGEICVSADTALAYAREHGSGFADELTLYVVHGWLHLAGYDDLQPAKKRRMRAAEARAMKLLRDANAVPPFRFR